MSPLVRNFKKFEKVSVHRVEAKSAVIADGGGGGGGGEGPKFFSTHAFHIHTHAIQIRLVALCISKSATKNLMGVT